MRTPPATVLSVIALFCLATGNARGASAERAPAEPGHYTDPGYWDRQYILPAVYDVYTITLTAKDRRRTVSRIEEHLHSIGGVRASAEGHQTEILNKPDATPLFWHVPATQALKASRDILRFGEVQSYYTGNFRRAFYDSSGPHPDELIDKKHGLRKEWESLRPHALSIPGVGYLLENQLYMAERLLTAHVHASTSAAFSILVAEQKQDDLPLAPHKSYGRANIPIYVPYDSILRDIDFPEKVRRQYAGDYWARSILEPGCGPQSNAIQVSITSINSIDRESVASILKKSGGVRLREKCIPPQFIPPSRSAADIAYKVSYWVKPKSINRIRRELARLGDIINWGGPRVEVWTPLPPHLADKVETLTNELDSNADLFEKSPMIRSLVQAERARLAPYQQISRMTQGRELIHLTVFRDSGQP